MLSPAYEIGICLVTVMFLFEKNYIEEEINNLNTVPALSCAFLGIIVLWEFLQFLKIAF